MVRELPAPGDLLLPRDRAPVLWVPAQTWLCVVCDPDGTGPVATSTVVWLGANTDGPHGRCSTCGQKFALARPFESVPAPGDQGWR